MDRTIILAIFMFAESQVVLPEFRTIDAGYRPEVRGKGYYVSFYHDGYRWYMRHAVPDEIGVAIRTRRRTLPRN